VIVDYHMHLRGLSRDGEGPVELTAEAAERFAETAAGRGVDEIGFTEHLYYFRQFGPLVEHPYQRERLGHDLDDYCEAVVEAQGRGLPVKLGLEVDWFPGREDELAEVLAPYPWDFLVGSVHILDGDAVDQEDGLWQRLPVEKVWRLYFAQLRDLARSGLVDVLAHLDLVKIFGQRPSPEVSASLRKATAEAVAASGVAVEVSTAGLRRPVGEIYPASDWLAELHARGVSVTTASDAHRPADAGRDLDRALEALAEAGYETVSVFEGRERRQEPLG
jgi:histidinol-phosphatase (PHP family)